MTDQELLALRDELRGYIWGWAMLYGWYKWNNDNFVRAFQDELDSRPVNWSMARIEVKTTELWSKQ